MIWQPGPFDPLAFQNEAVAHCVQHKRVLIPLPTGTGKTYIALRGGYELAAKRILVLCSGNALFTWKKNFLLHRPDLADQIAVISKMTAHERMVAYRTHNIIVMRVKTFAYDKLEDFSFDLIIGDECHKYMRSHKSAQFKTIESMCKRTKWLIFLSATPVSKGRQEYWPLLQTCRPQEFKSYWQFVGRYLIVMQGQFSKEIVGPKNTEQFREAVKNICFTAKSPITGLPKVVRSTIPIEMEPIQEKFYRQFEEEMWALKSSGDVLIASTILAKITRLRQLLCCPAIIDPALGFGAGIPAILDHMNEDLEKRHHCVWFTPFTQAIPFMTRALNEEGFHSVVTFQSGMELEDLEASEMHYRENPDSVAICSIMYAQSYELETGFPGYFCGYSWDPYDNMQGEGRLTRLTTKRDFIPMYYIQNMNTYDDRVLAVNGAKVSNTKIDMRNLPVIQNLFGPKDSP